MQGKLISFILVGKRCVLMACKPSNPNELQMVQEKKCRKKDDFQVWELHSDGTGGNPNDGVRVLKDGVKYFLVDDADKALAGQVLQLLPSTLCDHVRSSFQISIALAH